MSRRPKARRPHPSGASAPPAPAGGRATEFDKDVYREAAIERLELANELHLQAGERRQVPEQTYHYVMACYIAGLAVECILLAYLSRRGLPREDRHDLRPLAQRSGFLDNFADTAERDHLAAVLEELATEWWVNSHRYRSEAEFRRFLARKQNYKTQGKYVKGDIVKYCSGAAVNAANEIVAAGVRKWKTSRSEQG